MPVKIVAVRKDSSGKITHFKTNQGYIIETEQAASMARSGLIDSLTDIHEDGSWEIDHQAGTDEPIEGHNLTKLPEF